MFIFVCVQALLWRASVNLGVNVTDPFTHMLALCWYGSIYECFYVRVCTASLARGPLKLISNALIMYLVQKQTK